MEMEPDIPLDAVRHSEDFTFNEKGRFLIHQSGAFGASI